MAANFCANANNLETWQQVITQCLDKVQNPEESHLSQQGFEYLKGEPKAKNEAREKLIQYAQQRHNRIQTFTPNAYKLRKACTTAAGATLTAASTLTAVGSIFAPMAATALYPLVAIVGMYAGDFRFLDIEGAYKFYFGCGALCLASSFVAYKSGQYTWQEGNKFYNAEIIVPYKKGIAQNNLTRLQKLQPIKVNDL